MDSNLGLTARTDLLLNDILSDVDNILPLITEINATFSFDETDNSEQTIVEIAITERSVVNAFWLDFSNLTQDVDIRLYHKIDGTNYRQFRENSWLTANDDGILLVGFVANDDIKLTVQCSGAGAGSVNIPYSVL